MSELITLVPKTRHAKNKIHEVKTAMFNFDDKWKIIAIRDSVPFSSKGGPWWLVSPHGASAAVAQNLSRWVHSSTDVDFEFLQS